MGSGCLIWIISTVDDLIEEIPYSERAKPDVVVEGRTTETGSVSIALMLCVFRIKILSDQFSHD